MNSKDYGTRSTFFVCRSLTKIAKNPAKTRQHWVLGRIIELYPGPDGKVRNVKLLRGDADWEKKGGLKPELHSLQHLFPMELSITHPHTSPIPQSPEFKKLCEREAKPEQVASDAQLHLGPYMTHDPRAKEIEEDDSSEPEVEDGTEALNEPEPLLALAPQPVLDATQDIPQSQPLVSRRARCNVPSKRIMDNAFQFY